MRKGLSDAGFIVNFLSSLWGGSGVLMFLDKLVVI